MEFGISNEKVRYEVDYKKIEDIDAAILIDAVARYLTARENLDEDAELCDICSILAIDRYEVVEEEIEEQEDIKFPEFKYQEE